MTCKVTFISTLLYLLFCSSTFLVAQNRVFKPGEIWGDDRGVHINAHGGGVLTANGKYYWFGEHKCDTTSRAYVGVTCYSSEDLYNWKFESIALPVIERDPTHDITKGCVIERPKVIYNKATKKYVMWFHLELKGKGYDAARYAVAISDNVIGPYKYLYSGRANANKIPVCTSLEEFETIRENYLSEDWNTEGAGTVTRRAKNGSYLYRDFEGGQMSRDMTLYVDQDDKAYHIFSSENNQTLHIAELSNDYTTHTGRYRRILIGNSNEAPTIFKHNDKYWMITSGCTGWRPNAARLNYAYDIMGEWSYLKNPCVGNGANITFGAQGTYVMPVEAKENAFIFMADVWRPNLPSDGRYLWLPILFNSEGVPYLEWREEWDLSIFN